MENFNHSGYSFHPTDNEFPSMGVPGSLQPFQNYHYQQMNSHSVYGPPQGDTPVNRNPAYFSQHGFCQPNFNQAANMTLSPQFIGTTTESQVPTSMTEKNHSLENSLMYLHNGQFDSARRFDYKHQSLPSFSSIYASAASNISTMPMVTSDCRTGTKTTMRSWWSKNETGIKRLSCYETLPNSKEKTLRDSSVNLLNFPAQTGEMSIGQVDNVSQAQPNVQVDIATIPVNGSDTVPPEIEGIDYQGQPPKTVSHYQTSKERSMEHSSADSRPNSVSECLSLTGSVNRSIQSEQSQNGCHVELSNRYQWRNSSAPRAISSISRFPKSRCVQFFAMGRTEGSPYASKGTSTDLDQLSDNVQSLILQPSTSSTETGLIHHQLSTSSAETGLIHHQLSTSSAETGLIHHQPSTSSAETGLIHHQPSTSSTETGLINHQPSTSSAETGLMYHQPSTSSAETGLILQPSTSSGEIGVMHHQSSSSLPETGLIHHQPSTSSAETGLMYHQPSTSSAETGLILQPSTSSGEIGVMHHQSSSPLPETGLTHHQSSTSASETGLIHHQPSTSSAETGLIHHQPSTSSTETGLILQPSTSSSETGLIHHQPSTSSAETGLMYHQPSTSSAETGLIHHQPSISSSETGLILQPSRSSAETGLIHHQPSTSSSETGLIHHQPSTSSAETGLIHHQPSTSSSETGLIHHQPSTSSGDSGVGIQSEVALGPLTRHSHFPIAIAADEHPSGDEDDDEHYNDTSRKVAEEDCPSNLADLPAADKTKDKSDLNDFGFGTSLSENLNIERLMDTCSSVKRKKRLDIKVHIEESQCITEGNQRRWQCNMCEKSYTTKSNLITHILDHRGIKPHICLVCDRSFKQLSHLNTHMLKHDNLRPHVCQICGKGFTQISHMKRHLVVHMENKPHFCEICQRGFMYPSDLKTHQERNQNGECLRNSKAPVGIDDVTESGEMRCKECNKAFKYPSQLKDHMQIHSPVRPYICGECGVDFLKEHHLKAHQFTHTGLKPFECELCGRAFNQKANLLRHCLIHTAKRCYSCELCDKSFTQPQTLKAHMVTHSEKKPFQCKLCGKGFGRYHNLQGHMHIHDNSKPYICFCGCSFSLKGNLNRHKRVKHGLNESTESMEAEAVQLLKSFSQRAKFGQKRKSELANGEEDFQWTIQALTESGFEAENSYDGEIIGLPSDDSSGHAPRKQRKSSPRKVVHPRINTVKHKESTILTSTSSKSRYFTKGALGLQELSDKPRIENSMTGSQLNSYSTTFTLQSNDRSKSEHYMQYS